MNQQTVYATLYSTVFGGAPKMDTSLELSWQNLTVKSKRGDVRLLKDVCGNVKGRFLVVMGPSGSGKTTFLNQLSMRAKGMEVEAGSVTVGGQAYGHKDIKKISGYVMQDDILFEKLTVLETMQYAARLKMHPAASAIDRRRRIDKVLKILGLTKCKDVVVGSPFITGISGGQRKRLAVGIELLTRPPILFLDEPTSGLDSVSARSLIETLRGLSHKEKVTIVATLHQPSSSIFRLFDDLLVLHSGTVLYHGPASEMVDFYARAGLPCPPQTNPADWALDAISTDEGLALLTDTPDQDDGLDAVSSGDVLEEDFEKGVEVSSIGMQEVGDEERDKSLFQTGKRLGWPQQFAVLLHRSMRLALRERFLIGLQLVQMILMAVMLGTVFLLLPNTAATLQRRSSALFFCAINQGVFGALMTINVFPAERVVIMRERMSGLYYSSAYFVAKVVTEIVMQFAYPILFSCIVYFLIGLRPTAAAFFTFLGFMELTLFSANSIAMLISAAAGNVLLSAAALPFALEVCRLFGGFFMPPSNLPIYFVWIDSIVYVKYAYMGLMLNEFTDREVACGTATTCLSGNDFLNQLGINYIPLYACALVLLGLIIVMRLITYIILRIRP